MDFHVNCSKNVASTLFSPVIQLSQNFLVMKSSRVGTFASKVNPPSNSSNASTACSCEATPLTALHVRELTYASVYLP